MSGTDGPDHDFRRRIWLGCIIPALIAFWAILGGALLWIATELAIPSTDAPSPTPARNQRAARPTGRPQAPDAPHPDSAEDKPADAGAENKK